MTSSTSSPSATSLPELLSRKLIFVGGKGGVGKTSVSKALAQALARASARKKVLWVEFEAPDSPAGELKPVAPGLWHLNCDAGIAFEEYLALRLGGSTLARFFLQNRLIRYLAKAAPGVHELVLLGKIWHERDQYDHIVVDMRSTGYGIAMFQSTENFARLFQGGPIHRDAGEMIRTFQDPAQTGNLIVALPEEMPLRESLDLRDRLLALFPGNPPAFVVNRRFPDLSGLPESAAIGNPDDWSTPVAHSARDYALKRSRLEDFNLRLWREAKVPFGELGFIPPPPQGDGELLARLCDQLLARGWIQ